MDLDRFCKKIKNRKHDFCPKCKTLLDYEEYTDRFKRMWYCRKCGCFYAVPYDF